MTGIFECTRHFSMKRVSWEDIGFVIETNNTFLTEKLYDFVLEKVKTVAKVDDECHYLEDIVMDVLTYIINLYRSGTTGTKFSQVLSRLCLKYSNEYAKKDEVYIGLGNPIVTYDFENMTCSEDFVLYVHNLVNYLSPRRRKVIELYYFEEHSLSEIAKLMGVTYDYVCGLLRTSRRRLALRAYKDLRQGRELIPEELLWAYNIK